ncbi:MAG: tol-pal system protein YbgF [Pseudomonadota bacterium]
MAQLGNHTRSARRPPRLVIKLGAILLVLSFTPACLVTNLKKEKSFQELEQRVTRLAADTTAQFDALKKELTELKTKFTGGQDLTRTPAVPSPQADPLTPGQVNTLYAQARALFIKQDYSKAAELFSRIASGAPRHELAPNALYWLGECHYSRGDYQKAVTEFEKVVQGYPRSPKAPDAMLKIAYSYSSLKQGPTAMIHLKNLLQQYPGSQAARMVRTGQTVFKEPKIE